MSKIWGISPFHHTGPGIRRTYVLDNERLAVVVPADTVDGHVDAQLYIRVQLELGEVPEGAARVRH